MKTAAQNTSNQGWIKLHRKSLDSQVWRNPYLFQLWIYCLLRANHKAKWVSVTTGRGETQVDVKPSQFVFGRFKAAEALKAKPDATYKRLCKLEKLGNITTQNKGHYTLVTVCNWDFYQGSHTDDTTQVIRKHPPSSTDENEDNAEKFSQTSDEFRLACLLGTLILERKPDHKNVLGAKKDNWQKWAVHIDRMIRIDKRRPARIEEIIQWCQQDSGGGKWQGWRNNILSTEKLREKFDTLELAIDEVKIPAPKPLQRNADGRTPAQVLEAQIENKRN